MSDPIQPLDPFRDFRRQSPVLRCPFQGEEIPMILRHADVRAAARDPRKFSSNAPFRVPIPSEEEVRSMRQLPIETDPPDHTDYRAIVEPVFQRPKDPAFIQRVENLIATSIFSAIAKPALEIVSDLAVPIQSHALTYLLNVPEAEAATFISWGIHVFKTEAGSFKKQNRLEEYLAAQFERAEASPGDDFFSGLLKAEFRGRKLSREEMMGFANLTFAGGRDTIIHSISSIIGHLGQHPEGLRFLREDPKRITHASEEFFRVFMPLTHIGRVCPEATDVHGVAVPPNGRVSLGWASANFDEVVFDQPHQIRLDRKPNPHLSFGFGAHICLGAPHARLIVRTLLQSLVERVESIGILEARQHFENEARYRRPNGYDILRVRFNPRLSP